MNYCSKCGNLNSEEHKFCTKCGTKIEEQVEEEIIVNDLQSNQNKKENILNYNKIGGFLIFIGIILVLGLLGTVTFFNENYTKEYYELLATLYESNNELFTLLNISYYLTVICLFFLILLNISFFTKSNITKKLAITYFTLLIITDIYGVFIFSDNKEIMSKLSVEIIKISFQIVSASLFIIYFSISKRVKETFIEEKNFKLHIVIASIVPIILFFYYSDKLNEIKYELSNNDSSFSKTNSVSNGEINQPIQGNNTIQKSSTNVEIKQQSDTNNVKKEPIINKWKYKDWEIENIDDNFIKAFTIGKNRADVFTIIKKKKDCNTSFLYTTTHLFDKSVQVNENDILKMNIKVDNEIFNSDRPIYKIFNLGFVRQLISDPYPLYESFIEKLKNGNTIQTTVFSPILKDIDITPNEEYNLNGFTKTYNVLNEACRDISALNRYKEVDKNTINQYVSTNNGKMSLIKSIECDGKKVKLMRNDKNYLDGALLLLDNGKSIRLNDMNIAGDISSILECKKINGKSHLIIASTMGNSWEGHYSINIETFKADLLDSETEIKLGLKEEYVIEKTKMVINNIVYEVPKHPYDFAQNNEVINFENLLGSNYESFLWNLQVASNIEEVGQYYVGSGNGKSSGGMYEAIFTIDKFTGNTSVAILTTDYNKNHTKNIKYFGDITYPIEGWAKKLQ